eukprot:6891048-Alexandrium_andersonii.AAC.1
MTLTDRRAPWSSLRALACDSSAPTRRLTTSSPCNSLAGGGSTVICSNCRVSDATPSALGRSPSCLSCF